MQEMETVKKQSTRVFLIRLFIYIFLGLITPLTFLIIRFDLFRTTSTVSVGGWGICAVIFMAVFMIKLIAQAETAVNSVLARQIMRAVRKVLLPLLAATLSLYAVKNFVDGLVEFLAVLVICEPIAYVVNPMPQFLKDADEEEDEKKANRRFAKFAEVFWSKK